LLFFFIAPDRLFSKKKTTNKFEFISRRTEFPATEAYQTN
jgi:hypothetical protein